MEKVVSLQELKSIVAKLKHQNKQIVWTNGCFDLLHIGHVTYLEQAKAIGDILVVGLNNDASVKIIKGEKRPLFNQVDRAKVLSALTCIDYIIIFHEASPIKIIEELKPDFYVKGGDYTIDTINQPERRVVENYGGTIKILPNVGGVSTSEIIKKIERLEMFI